MPFDIDTGVVRRSRVLVQHVPGAVLYLALGTGGERFLRRLASVGDLLKANFNPGQPRVPSGEEGAGEWTQDAGLVPVAASAVAADDTLRRRKQRFVDAHLAAAEMAARELGVPVENILGLSALESGWGDHRFAAHGNNYFGIHYPAPFASGYVTAEAGRTKVATFASYADSARSFAAISGSIVRDVGDPRAFAVALQNSGKFGVDKNGAKVPTYVDDVAKTIRGLRLLVSRRSI